MGRTTFTMLLVFTISAMSYGADFYLKGAREEMNLAGADWKEAIADTLDLQQIPTGLEWITAKVPTENINNKLKSVDHMWMYCVTPPEKYIAKDGTLRIKEKLSAWYQKIVEVPAELIQDHTTHLTIAGASYRSAVIVNGKFAGESIQSTVPLDFDITAYMKPGNNTITIAITPREGLIDLKNQVYLAPSMGALPGIRGPIRLEFRPFVAIDDVFVKTSVKNKNIDFQITIQNSGDQEKMVTPTILVRSKRDPKQVVGKFTGKPVSIAPKSEITTNIKENWIAPILWSPTTPEIYIADVSLVSDGKLVDDYQQTFGFREFSIKGKDFLLNGKRTVLLRDSSLNSLKTLEHNPEEVSITRKPSSINSIRQHLGACNTDLIHRANQQGIMVIPESAWSWDRIYPSEPEKIKHWLPGTLDYFKRWARQMRNEPSVVIYSLANETYWERQLPEEMKVAKQIVDVMRQEDPTRPLQADGDNYWGGLLDIINIHYPEGTAGTLRLKYPNSAVMVPNDIEWLSDKVGEGQSWRCKFVWDRPLILGEFGGGTNAESQSSYSGDDTYNWIKWKKNPSKGRDIGSSDRNRASGYTATLRKMINYYRHMGVAGMNPWTGDLNEVLKTMMVDPLDFHPNVDAGGVFKRKLVAFNDEERNLNKIKCYLTIDGVIVGEKEIKIHLLPGQKWSGDVSFSVPNLDHPAKAEFMARLIWTRGKKDIEVDRFIENIHIVPQIDLRSFSSKICVIDPKKSLGKLFEELKLDKVEKLVKNEIPKGKKLLIIGVDGYQSDMRSMLDTFVEYGGVVLMLPQKDWKPYRIELPERDPRHAATQAWLRRPDHPIFHEMDEKQFSFWKDDNVISYETFKKPTQGPFKVLLDCGGRYGLSWSPMLEIPIGKGAFLMTTLELTKPDPVVKQLFANIVEYGCERKPVESVSLNLMAGDNQALIDALKLTGVKIFEGIGKSGPVLIDASANIKPGQLKDILGRKRVIWLHGFTPKTFAKVKDVLPSDAKLKALPKGAVEMVTLANDPLIESVANYDLLWHIPASWQGPKSVIAKAGDWTLDTNFFVKDAKALTSPPLLAKLDAGEGTILFDTLRWEDGIGKVTDKSLRIASTILTNLGCGFAFEKQTTYKNSFVNLAKFANMGYMDKVADDGIGGWTDQGENDMRFFLINHSGRMGGKEDGMEVPIPPFPADVEFNGVPYKLVDPKTNDGKAVLSFGSPEHASKLMRQAGPIPVDEKANKLWFLHAVAWMAAPGVVVAEYTVKYEDGTTTTIPIRSGVDVGDWHNVSKFVNASIAWNGRNLKSPSVGIHSMVWNNPNPEKTIKTLSIKAGLSHAQYVLLAITCGVETSEEESVLYDLDLKNPPQDKKLFMKAKQEPQKTADGLLFSHGSSLALIADKVGLKEFTKHPFAVVFEMTVDGKPDGWCAGIAEFGPFRITLNKNSMKVVVETFDANGKRIYINSRDPVELNKRVKFEYKSDGKKGVLLRDGKIDAIADAALPNRDPQFIRLGKAGGKDYNFNGTIHRLIIKKL